MKKESKYYTPSYDEFCVGFEYENFVKGKGWTSRILENLQNQDLNEEGFCLDGDDYRVKYLDRQDIIDLGWKYNGLFFEYADCSLSEDGNRVTIYDVSDNVIFNGKIKNKSELKKIMRMLEII